MDSEDEAKLLAYIKSLPDFEIKEQIDAYDHIGAVVVDGILQASLRYVTVVKPRVDKVLLNYPNAKTTTKFIAICDQVGIKELINWKDDKKPNYILSLLQFLKNEQIETVLQLRTWLQNSDNKQKFIKENKGIGAVTSEYFRILTGDESVKIDRHVKVFLANAGISTLSIPEAIKLITKVAKQLDIKPSVLDYSVWSYQAVKRPVKL